MAKTTNNRHRVKAGPAREKAPAAKKKAAAAKIEADVKIQEPSLNPLKPKGRSIERVTEEERRRMISEAAYYRAERRGFTGGNSLDDWFAAESEIDAKLARDYLS
jgi:hypothetical protein